MPNSSPQPPAMFTHMHSGILLSTLYLFFPSVVADPSPTLFSTLPALVAVQTIYCILCLDLNSPSPPLRSTITPSSKRSSPTSKKASVSDSLASKILPALLALALASTLGTAVLYFFLVVFGAPLTTHFPETIALALHSTLLVAYPLIFRYGVDGTRWQDLVGFRATVEEAYFGASGACIGMWLGAIPIPLDWDREWQKWPCTILVGLYLGYVVGKGAGNVWRGSKTFGG